jgi:hypothetical protein
MLIDWTAIPAVPLGLLAGLTFLSSLIGNSLIKNAFVGAIFSAIIFAAIYIGWNFYLVPKGLVGSISFPTK